MEHWKYSNESFEQNLLKFNWDAWWSVNFAFICLKLNDISFLSTNINQIIYYFHIC